MKFGVIQEEQVIDLNYAYRTMLEAKGVIRSAPIAEAFVPANMVEFLRAENKAWSWLSRLSILSLPMPTT